LVALLSLCACAQDEISGGPEHDLSIALDEGNDDILAGACTPGTKRCEGLTPQICGADSTWQSGAGCEFVCTAGDCMGACTPGEMNCDGLIPRTCGTNGMYTNGATCPYACNAGVCSGMCTAGELACVDSTHAEACDGTGTWQVTTCAQLCSSTTKQCACNAGYTASGASCTPINFCQAPNGGCSPHATCAQTGDTPTCTCKSGYVGDGFTCAMQVTAVSQGFDDITTLPAAGWLQQNDSNPLGSNGWFQGTDVADGGPFDAFAGAAASSYIAANFNNTTGSGTIDNWLATPLLTFGSDTSVSFYTRSDGNFADRIEVRLCVGATCALPTDASAGTYTTVLGTINPNLLLGVYPTTWTQLTYTNATGLPYEGQGRVAIRYYVTDGGPEGDNSDYIGVDSFVVAAGPAAYAVRGTVSGLTGSGLVLWLNGNAQMPVAANGAFDFGKHLDTGTLYSVTVFAQPAGQTCVVTNGAGTIAAADITNVTVACTNN
jgi:hypothetical protein